MSEPFQGVLPALITPFTDDGEAIDTRALAAIVDRLVGAGVGGLVPGGSTGEFTTLTNAERRRLVEATVEAAAGRVPVVAGTGALATRETVELSVHAERAGAAAVMIVPPFYDPLPWRELHAHYTAVADAIAIPIMYYNLPSATGVTLTAAQLRELPVASLKDTGGDAVLATELIQTGGPALLNGWDTLTFAALAAGVRAVVWGVGSIVPEQCVELHRLLIDDIDLPAARELWARLWPLCRFLESRSYPAAVKTACRLMGDTTVPSARRSCRSTNPRRASSPRCSSARRVPARRDERPRHRGRDRLDPQCDRRGRSRRARHHAQECGRAQERRRGPRHGPRPRAARRSRVRGRGRGARRRRRPRRVHVARPRQGDRARRDRARRRRRHRLERPDRRRLRRGGRGGRRRRSRRRGGRQLQPDRRDDARRGGARRAPPPAREILDYAASTKPDAPSGTARELAERLGEVRKPQVDLSVDRVSGRPDARGATVAGAQIHSVRLPSFVVSTDIVFGAADERLSIRHDAGGSAASYVAGVLVAVRRARGHVGLIRGLDRLLLA